MYVDILSSGNLRTHGDSGQTPLKEKSPQTNRIIASRENSQPKAQLPKKSQQTSQQYHFSCQETGVAPAASVEFSRRSQPDQNDDQVTGGKHVKQLTQNGSMVESGNHPIEYRCVDTWCSQIGFA